MTRIVDAHVHVWDLGAAAYNWLGPDLAPIDRTMAIEEVMPEFHALNIQRCVLVQAADNDQDTQHMLNAMDTQPIVAGVVAWVPLEEGSRVRDRVLALRDDRRVVGVRSLIHTRSDPGWILSPQVDIGLGALERAAIPFDFVTASPAAIDSLVTVAERHPGLALVLDHLGKPPIGGARDEYLEWRRLIARAARHPGVHAKISGLYSRDGDPRAIRPFVLDALELFGPERLMYGGDWPISILSGGYRPHWDAIIAALDGVVVDEVDQILGLTAERFYRLNDAPHMRGGTAG